MTETAQIQEHHNLLRVIFLNLLIIAFITISYVYISEPIGSISTPFLINQEFSLQFGITLLIFSFFSVLAGSVNGFIAGFLGELLFQLAFYNSIFLDWCFIVAILGFLCGLYKYKPLKYHEGIKVYFTFMSFIVISFIISGLITLFQSMFYESNYSIEDIILNYGFNYFLNSLISIIFIVPIILVIYDKILAKDEKDLYYMWLTHHPISASDHTFYLKFGRTKIYFCTRCSGVIIGGLIALFTTYLTQKILGIVIDARIALLLIIILPLPVFIDWGTQRLLLRKSTTESRLLTGFIVGLAFHFMSFTYDLYFYTVLILIAYFSIFFLLAYFGHKKEMRLLEEELDELSYEEAL